jgi:tetratricopeptide (TPR) repeat protein
MKTTVNCHSTSPKGNLIVHNTKGKHMQNAMDNATEFQVLNDEVFISLEKKDLKRALPIIKKELTLMPDNFLPYLHKAEYHQIKGEFNKAIQCYETVLEINPDCGFAYYEIGICLSSIGKKREAIDSFKEALKHNYKFSHVYDALIRIQIERKCITEAYKYLQEAILECPENGTFYLLLASLIIERGEELGVPISAQVLKQLDKAGKKGCDNSILNRLRGEYYFGVSDWKKASKFFSISLMIKYDKDLAVKFASCTNRLGKNLSREAASYLKLYKNQIEKAIKASKN